MSTNREKKPSEWEKRSEEPSVSAFIQPFDPPARKRTRGSSPPTETGEVKDIKTSLGEKRTKTQPFERTQKQDEASEKQKEEVLEMKYELKGETKETISCSMVTQSASSPPSSCLGQIDSIMDKHLGDLSSEIKLILQGENSDYSWPQSPPSTSNTDSRAVQHTLPHPPISQFSHYVSFYNPFPPVHDYISSMQDSIDHMLTGLASTDATLASKVSAFVSSIRAAKPKTYDDTGLCDERTTADASGGHTPAPSRGESQRPRTLPHFPEAANNDNTPAPRVTLCASDSFHKPTNAAVHHPPAGVSPQSHWEAQHNPTSEITHSPVETPHRSVLRTALHTAAAEQAASAAATSCQVTCPAFGGVSNPQPEPSLPSKAGSNLASVPRPQADPSDPATALSSLISQLKPEVFNNLVEIIKDVKRNFVQFYLHSTEPEDRVYGEVKVTCALLEFYVQLSSLSFI